MSPADHNHPENELGVDDVEPHMLYAIDSEDEFPQHQRDKDHIADIPSDSESDTGAFDEMEYLLPSDNDGDDDVTIPPDIQQPSAPRPIVYITSSSSSNSPSDSDSHEEPILPDEPDDLDLDLIPEHEEHTRLELKQGEKRKESEPDMEQSDSRLHDNSTGRESPTALIPRTDSGPFTAATMMNTNEAIRLTRASNIRQMATVESESESEEDDAYDEFVWRARGRRPDIHESDVESDGFQDPYEVMESSDQEESEDEPSAEDESDSDDELMRQPQRRLDPEPEPEHPPEQTPEQQAHVDQDAIPDYRFYIRHHGFDFMNVQDSFMSEREFSSIAVHSIRHYKGMSRQGEEDITELMKIQNRATRPFYYRTTESRILDRTGLEIERFDVCRRGCFCFAADPEAPDCPWCGDPRLDETGTPFKTFDYVKLIPRLKLQYSSRERAQTFMTYRKGAFDRSIDAEDPKLVDFWGSKVHKELVNDGLFDQDTDLGFFFSTDGIDVFRERTSFSVWPLILINLSLPPSERYSDENVIHLGVVPGPKNPRDLDSFLHPFQTEMKELEIGVRNVYNGATGKPFTLRAHICVIGADIPARKKLTHTTGINSYTFCMYCKATALGSQTNCYCPFLPPTKNLPKKGEGKGHASKLPRKSYMPPIVEQGAKLARYEPKKLEKRTHEDFLEAMQLHLKDKKDEAIAKAGVTGYSIFAELKSIRFPRSFPYDGMHLWFENIIPRLFNHWRGRFNSKKGGQLIVVARPAGESEGVEESGSEEDRPRRQLGGNNKKQKANNAESDTDHEFEMDPTTQSINTNQRKGSVRGRPRGKSTSQTAANKRKRSPLKQKTSGKDYREEPHSAAATVNPADSNRLEPGLKTVSKRNIAKFEASGEAYCIHPDVWARIGADMNRTRDQGLIPSVFGTNIRSISDHVHQWKAEEWRNWALRYSSVYMLGVLPEPYYGFYKGLVHAIWICCKYELTEDDIDLARTLIDKFIRHYERDYYKRDYERLSMCLPVFHYIAHVADSLADVGPQFVYTQWCVERACGTLSRGVKSRSEVNRNISLNVVRMECYNHLRFTVSEKSFYRTVDETNQEQVDAMVANARWKYNYLRRILSRGGAMDGGGTKHKATDVRDGGDGAKMEMMQAKKPISCDIGFRRLMRESATSSIWSQLTADQWKSVMLKRFTYCKFSTETTRTLMYSSLLKPRMVKRQASVVLFTAQHERDMLPHIGEIVYFFDVVPADTVNADPVWNDLCESYGSSLVAIRGFDLSDRRGSMDVNIRSIERRGAVIVVPAKLVDCLIGIVLCGNKQFLVNQESAFFHEDSNL